MPEAVHRLSFELPRLSLPAGLDPGGTSFRHWLMDGMVDWLALEGTCPEALRFFGADFEDRLLLAELPEEARRAAGAFFRQLALRPGILRSFRQGAILSPGARKGVLVLLELREPVHLAWRLDWRPFALQQGLGRPTGPWQGFEGRGPSALPEPLRSWLSAEAVIEEFHLAPVSRPPPEPDVRVAFAEVSPTLPRTAEGLSGWVAHFLRDEPREGFPDLLLLVLEGEQLERWEVRGTLPCSQADFVRAVAQGREPDALVLVQPCALEVGGGLRHCFRIEVEAGGRRLLCFLSSEEGGGCSFPYCEVPRRVGGEDAWIGVPPAVELHLEALNAWSQEDAEA